MTFIDVEGKDPTAGFIAGYSILSVVSLTCAAWAIHLGRTRMHYHSFFSVRILFPLALFIFALENVALAISGRVYDQLTSDGDPNNNFEDSLLFIKVVFILQPFIVPILLVVVFELTYLVHKRRSVNFCGMYFDEGRRVYDTAVMSCMLRNSIRTLATLLLIMGLLVNLNIIEDAESIESLAGMAGWWSYFKIEENVNAKMHLLLSLLPTAVLVLVSIYLSVMLWRYGTESSMVVHSSICNPWFYPFFGTVAMTIGQLFGPYLYNVMSNIGELLFVITLLALMAEVDKDIVATNEVACFLVQVAQKGDEISVAALSRADQMTDESCVNTMQQQTAPSTRQRLSLSKQNAAGEEKTFESNYVTESVSNTPQTGAFIDEESGDVSNTSGLIGYPSVLKNDGDNSQKNTDDRDVSNTSGLIGYPSVLKNDGDNSQKNTDDKGAGSLNSQAVENSTALEVRVDNSEGVNKCTAEGNTSEISLNVGVEPGLQEDRNSSLDEKDYDIST